MRVTNQISFQGNRQTGIINRAEFINNVLSTEFPIVTKKDGTKYYNVPAAFDIEVSSFYSNGEKNACMYVWQFGLLNWVTYGRTWQEYFEFIKILSSVLGLSNEMILPVYIQNFAYEFQFMRKRVKWDKLFFLDTRKPIYGIAGGIEYRCSLKLSGKSLEKMGKDLQKYKCNKMVGDLNYLLIRTQDTPLTEKEWGYCELDIRVLLSYIQEKIEHDGDITKIPMTNTGYVRDYCRKRCFRRFKDYKSFMSELTLTPDEYKQLKRGFQGGFTHANSSKVGKILTNVASYDFTSSYPAVMVAEKFPMSSSSLVDRIDSKDELEHYLKNYCCLFNITLYDVVPKIVNDHPISASKCWGVVKSVEDNGRVVVAEKLSTTVTEQDYYTYREYYSWSHMDISEFRIYEKAYLPKPMVMSLLDLYGVKTTLKGVEGEEVNYLISKGMLNSAYGMAVTDIVRDIISYENNEYSQSEPDIKEAIDKYNKGVKRFLFYPWGVWVTAYARANLFSGILSCGDDYIYADTDSVKILNPEKHKEYFSRYNMEITNKLLKAANHHHIDPIKFSPPNRKGVQKPLGVWDYEGIYDEFKTIGAKRYLVKKGDNYELTVAGVNKKKACKYIVNNYKNPMDGLSTGLVVPKEFSGRLTLTYLDDGCEGIITDYLGNKSWYKELSAIHMEPSEYELTISDEYREFLQSIRGSREIL